MNTPRILGLVKSTCLLAVLGLAVTVAPRASAQAQSLLSQNGVVISAIEPVLSDGPDASALLVTGINFPRTPKAGYPVVSLVPSAGLVTPLHSVYDGTTILATLPPGFASSAGTYRLMVTFGPGTNVTDVMEFTIGAVGLTGEKGEKGDQGIQGAKGDQGDQGVQGPKGDQGAQGPKGDQGAQGIQGVKGDQGEKGEQGEKGDVGAPGIPGASGATGLSDLPIFQNKVAALNAGLVVGDFWVQENSGHVYRIMNTNPIDGGPAN